MRLIDADELKKTINFVYNCDYIGSKSKEGIASDIIAEIDNAPTVKTYCYYCGQTEHGKIEEKSDFKEGYKQAILDCKTNFQRQKGEWIIDGHHIRCNRCNEYICNTDREGNKIPDNFCPNCGADMRGEEG